MYRKFLLGITLFFITKSLAAQTIVIPTGEGEEDNIRISPIGRFYYDGALYTEDKTSLSNGISLTDIRLGAQIRYNKWFVKMDVSFASSRVSAKDIFIQYSFRENSFVRGGHFYEPFGVDQMEGSSGRRFISNNATTQAFSSGRKVGAQYVGWKKNLWFSGGIFGDTDNVSNSTKGDDGYAFTGRFVFNPALQKDTRLHFGLVGTFRKADANGYDEDGNEKLREITYASTLNTNVDDRDFLSVTIEGADYQAKYGAEFIGVHQSFFVQSEFMYTTVSRKQHLPWFHGNGIYLQAGILLGGKKYEYSNTWARLDRPDPESLEFVLRYNYTDMDNYHSGLFGGKMSDWTLACNYYLNRFLIFRFNYSNIQLGKNSPVNGKENINVFQGRIQVIF